MTLVEQLLRAYNQKDDILFDDALKHVTVLQDSLIAAKAEATRLMEEIGEPPVGSHPDESKPRAQSWHKERQNWQAEVVELRDQRLLVQELVNALQLMYDAQNGPPLLTPRHKDFWQRAMNATTAALKRAQEKGVVFDEM